jgi:hypothetical protein
MSPDWACWLAQEGLPGLQSGDNSTQLQYYNILFGTLHISSSSFFLLFVLISNNIAMYLQLL